MTEDDDDARWRWLSDELKRAEAHWTSQVQNQQQRAASILTANTFLLGLLANIVVKEDHNGAIHGRSTGTMACAVLAFALLPGIVALWPKLKIERSSNDLTLSGGSFVSASWLSHAALKLPKERAEQLSLSLKTNLDGRHERALDFRRWALRVQLVAIGLGAIMFIVFLKANL